MDEETIRAYGPGKSYYLLSEDQLRELILEWGPELRADNGRLCDRLRELVDFERQKAGFDNPRGRLELWPNKDKKALNDPDLIGTGLVAGRRYRAAAWASKDGKVKVSLLPSKR